ncbi:MAG: Oxygen regulatory protein NreC [Bryobacteraceae bacterium]|nr:Oxygen regulatory protein NreC [Bryobacteraceae bacterium]
MPIRILLADDHRLFRAGMRRILEENPDLLVVAEASSGSEAVEQAKLHLPDVAVIDISMKELNGIEAIERILRQSPQTGVLVLSMHSDERYVIRAVRAGAQGYLLKDSVEEGLLEAIESVHHGKPYFSPAVARILRQRERRDPKLLEYDDLYETLTGRERHIYHLLAEGLGSKEIAARLGISVHTVETHRTRVMEKLELHGIAELVLSAVRRGLVG